MKKRKRRQLTNKRKRFLIANAFLALFLFIGIGYSAFNTDLNIFGDVTIKKPIPNNTLYNVMKDYAEEGTYALEYEGEHQDSMNPAQSNKKIYYFHTENLEDYMDLINKSVVVFAGKCWRILRTTDTGGVKLVYYSPSLDNKCDWGVREASYYSHETVDSSTYWYGTDYIFDSTNNTFTISGTTEQASLNETTLNELMGKYTCKLTDLNDTCKKLYLVASDTVFLTIEYADGNTGIGRLIFNDPLYRFNLLQTVGYMYNTKYSFNLHGVDWILMNDIMFIYPDSKKADSISWNTPVAGKYSLINPTNGSEDPNDYINKYMVNTPDITGDVAYYITGLDTGSSVFYITLENGEMLEDYNLNHTITYGSDYVDNNNGTYTIINPTTFPTSEWFNRYTEISPGDYVCENAINGTCSDLLYTKSTNSQSLVAIHVKNKFKYANSFTYDGEKYILSNDNITFWNTIDPNNKAAINNHHYTCWNESGECNTLSYVIIDSDDSLEYINLENGKSIYDAINEMLYNDDANQLDSPIKVAIEAWYKKNLLKYDSYIDDVIYCNDRTIIDAGGLNPNGGNILDPIKFKGSTTLDNLSCQNITDRFSISNNKAKLNYKIGLPTVQEINLFENIVFKMRSSWTMSPYMYDSLGAGMSTFDFNMVVKPTYSSISPRDTNPTITLKADAEYIAGDGSLSNPFIIDTSAVDE